MMTVLNKHGVVQGSGMSVKSAAETILTYDGHEFDIRTDDGLLELWVSEFSRNSACGGRPLVQTGFFGRTESDIYDAVCRHADYWDKQRCMTDAEYEAHSQVVD